MPCICLANGHDHIVLQMANIVPTFTSRAKLNLTSMLPRDYDPRLQPSGQDGNALQIGVQMNVFGVLEVKLFNRIYIYLQLCTCIHV